MIRARLNPASHAEIQPKKVVGVLLPLPLAGAYDYKLPPVVDAPRGTLVAAPLGNREVLGAVWGKCEGTVGDNRLKEAVPLDVGPRLPEKLCDFIDWVADYTLYPPGAILAMALRSSRDRAFMAVGRFSVTMAISPVFSTSSTGSDMEFSPGKGGRHSFADMAMRPALFASWRRQ